MRTFAGLPSYVLMQELPAHLGVDVTSFQQRSCSPKLSIWYGLIKPQVKATSTFYKRTVMALENVVEEKPSYQQVVHKAEKGFLN